MSASKSVSYKGIQLHVNPLYNSVELIVDHEMFHNIESYILKISLMMEFATYNKPEYIIINRLDSDFTIPKDLYKFTNENIFNTLIKNGISKILMVVKEGLYKDSYINITETHPDLIAFTNIEDAYDWIKDVKRN